MFVAKDIVFMELHKTGSSHIRRILKELLQGDLIGHHNQANADFFVPGRKFIGSIRNPWEWYLSLWSYGCENKGAVFYNVTSANEPDLAKSNQQWANTYTDVDNKDAFREWLSMMHDPKYALKIAKKYGECTFNDIAGLLTHRYLTLFCTKSGESKKLKSLSTYDEVHNYENEYCVIDRFVHLENLESDLFQVLDDFAGGISNKTKSEILAREKSNVSPRKYGAEYYYDQRSIDRISVREKLIIDKFGYSAPCL